MRSFPIVLCGALCAGFVAQAGAAETPRAVPAHAGQRPAVARSPNAAKKIGTFEDWTAATHNEAGQAVCYAFTRAATSVPAVAGRGDVVLTVTERPSGRDEVALSAGFEYPTGAGLLLVVDRAELSFYTSKRSAFARDGKAVVLALDKGRTALARSAGPKGVAVADTFSLHGFAAAYQAIAKACPAK